MSDKPKHVHVTNEQLCHTIARLSERFPELRVMQLIINAVPEEILDRLDNDLYYVDNDDLMVYLLSYEVNILKQRGDI